MSGATKRVLLVDDDVALTRSIVHGFATCVPDLSIVALHTADAALGMLRDGWYCIVIDLKLGDRFDGFRVLDARRLWSLEMAAIAMSGQMDAKTMHMVEELGAAPLTKGGFDLDTLIEMIRRPPLAAYYGERLVLEALIRSAPSFERAKTLPLSLVEHVYEREGRCLSRTASALGTTRQRVQDLIKRQLPRRT